MVKMDYDEWEDAQDEKKELLKKATKLTEVIPVEFSGINDLEFAAGLLTSARHGFDDIMAKYRRLESDFPGDSEPDPDTAYDDNVWEGDR
jgi:hypothetical protein